MMVFTNLGRELSLIQNGISLTHRRAIYRVTAHTKLFRSVSARKGYKKHH